MLGPSSRCDSESPGGWRARCEVAVQLVLKQRRDIRHAGQSRTVALAMCQTGLGMAPERVACGDIRRINVRLYCIRSPSFRARPHALREKGIAHRRSRSPSRRRDARGRVRRLNRSGTCRCWRTTVRRLRVGGDPRILRAASDAGAAAARHRGARPGPAAHVVGRRLLRRSPQALAHARVEPERVDRADQERAAVELAEHLDVLEPMLAGREYLLGEFSLPTSPTSRWCASRGLPARTLLASRPVCTAGWIARARPSVGPPAPLRAERAGAARIAGASSPPGGA